MPASARLVFDGNSSPRRTRHSRHRPQFSSNSGAEGKYGLGEVYAPLWCKSNFSFLEGASDPAELIEQAGHLGLRSIAVTDRDGLYGVVDPRIRYE